MKQKIIEAWCFDIQFKNHWTRSPSSPLTQYYANLIDKKPQIEKVSIFSLALTCASLMGVKIRYNMKKIREFFLHIYNNINIHMSDYTLLYYIWHTCLYKCEQKQNKFNFAIFFLSVDVCMSLILSTLLFHAKWNKIKNKFHTITRKKGINRDER